jgi:hypothetical protein
MRSHFPRSGHSQRDKGVASIRPCVRAGRTCRRSPGSRGGRSLSTGRRPRAVPHAHPRRHTTGWGAAQSPPGVLCGESAGRSGAARGRARRTFASVHVRPGPSSPGRRRRGPPCTYGRVGPAGRVGAPTCESLFTRVPPARASGYGLAVDQAAALVGGAGGRLRPRHRPATGARAGASPTAAWARMCRARAAAPLAARAAQGHPHPVGAARGPSFIRRAGGTRGAGVGASHMPGPCGHSGPPGQPRVTLTRSAQREGHRSSVEPGGTRGAGWAPSTHLPDPAAATFAAKAGSGPLAPGQGRAGHSHPARATHTSPGRGPGRARLPGAGRAPHCLAEVRAAVACRIRVPAPASSYQVRA